MNQDEMDQLRDRLIGALEKAGMAASRDSDDGAAVLVTEGDLDFALTVEVL